MEKFIDECGRKAVFYRKDCEGLLMIEKKNGIRSRQSRVLGMPGPREHQM